MNAEQRHADAVSFVENKLSDLNYPNNHPFNDYPKTPESMTLELIILIKAFTNKNDLVISFLKKCKSVENGVFSFEKYNQNISEVIWFYYLYMGLLKTESLRLLVNIYDENVSIYDNGKKFEYSYLMADLNLCPKYIVNSEVKTLLCDPFKKENELKCTDGQELIKPLFPDLRVADKMKTNSDVAILQSSTYYYQVEQNIKRIINKCRGNNISGFLPFNIGVLVINASTSFEEFYSYLFHQDKGIYGKLLKSNVDSLVLLSMDARNDFKLENIYSSGYVQTALVNPTEDNKNLCRQFHIDNYISLGEKIDSEVYKLGQHEYGHYKILCRDGFVNIIPFDATGKEITEYISYLKGTNAQT